jgi:tetratricopeptide (TPR) repeat protein
VGRGLLVPLLVAVVAVAVFLPALEFGFLPVDDYANVSANPRFRGVSSSGLSWVLTTRVLGHWIPMTWLSFAVDHALWGRNPRGYHATNIGLHALGAALWYVLARRLLRLAAPTAAARAVGAGALVAALAFGVHPLRVESVAWVTERRDVLSGVLFFLAVLAYLRSVAGRASASWRWLGCSVVAFVGAQLAKEIVMTLPVVLLILDVYPLRRFRWPSSVVEKLPFALVAAAGAAVSAHAVAADIGFTDLGRLGVPARLALVGYSAVFYPVQTFVPVDLSPIHEFPLRVDPLAPRFLAGLAAAVALTALVLLARRRAPWLPAAWAYSVATILPVSGLAHVSTILVADRYSYLSTLSWALVLGGGVTALLGERRRALAIPALAGVIALLGAWAFMARARVEVWRDGEHLFTAAALADPECAQCRAGLGMALLAAGRVAEAERESALAVVLRPERAAHHAILAAVLEREGRLDDAARAWAVAARLNPRYEMEARRILGLALAGHGRFEESARELRAARGLWRPSMLPVTPHLVRALNDLAIARARAGRLDDAAAALEEALALAPDNAEVRGNLAAVARARRR